MSAHTEVQSTCNTLVRLKNRRNFLRLRSGRKYSTGCLTVQSAKQDPHEHADTCRVGFTVTTKIGNAVERNRIRRRLKCAAGEVIGRFGEPGRDYVIIARRKCLNCAYAAILTDLQQALDHIHANRAKGSKRQTEIPT